MNLYTMQEFLGVLLVLAALTGTILVLGIGLLLFQEGMRWALHGRQTRLISVKGVRAKDQWLQAQGRSILR
jgi:hypothetical protein